MSEFRRLGESELFSGILVSVARTRVEGPGGEVFEREIVHHPGAVVVVPLAGDEPDLPVLMVRQYRAAVGAELLELPAGRRDHAGEPPESTAARELVEEVGRQPGRLELIARFYNSPGFTDELSWLYLGRDLTPVAHSRQGVEERHMSVEELPLATALELVTTGEIVDAKTIIGLSLTRRITAAGR